MIYSALFNNVFEALILHY